MFTNVLILIGLLATMTDGGAAEQRDAELSQYFGFDTYQVYKIKPRISQLRIADLDGDGRSDIALWNGWKNRIELFYQPDPETPQAGGEAELERNEVPNRGNLRMENIPVPYRVATMQVAKLTGDDRPDIVFFGEPKELVILPGEADGGFGAPQGIRANDGDPRPNGLVCGDFNSDNRTDVALLADNAILLFHQQPGGGLAKPQRLVHNLANLSMILAAELDGDGRDDLVGLVDDDEYGAVAFIQNAQGALGAMRRVKVPRLRSMTVADGQGGDDLFCVESATGRLVHYRWETPAQAGDVADWPQLLYSYPVRGKSKKRPIAVGDITGDEIVDIVAADPDAALLILFEGTAAGLAPGVPFPGLVKTIDIQISDVDGDGVNDLISISREEKMVGVSHFDSGRLTFPEPLALDGAPLALAPGALADKDEKRCIAALAKHKSDGDGDKTVNRISLLALPDLQPIRSWEIGELDDDPAGLRFADVNQDGRNDLLLFVEYSPLKTWLQNEDGTFTAFDGPQTRQGLVNTASIEGFATLDVTGDGRAELILAQKNLARALAVRDGQWTVVDQYNPEDSDAQINGLAALADGDHGPVLALYDRKSRELLVFRKRADGAYAVAKSMPVGSFDVQAAGALPIGPQGDPGMFLADAEKLAVFYPGRTAPTLVEKRTYESDAKDVWLSDAVVGDLNHDGIRDVVAVDVRKAALEILTSLPDQKLARAIRFQVFQGKRFSDEPDRGGDPREVLIADVTGDDIDDIVLIAHDRMIVYPGQ